MTNERSLPRDTVNHYSRDGFVGTGAHTTRPNYVPMYARIEGEYAPYRLRSYFGHSNQEDPLPDQLTVPLLSGNGVSISAMRVLEPMVITAKNVISDEVYYVVAGEGRIKTDFGFLNNTFTAGIYIIAIIFIGFPPHAVSLSLINFGVFALTLISLITRPQ